MLRVRFRVVDPRADATEIRIGDGPTPLELVDREAETIPVRALPRVLHLRETIAIAPSIPPIAGPFAEVFGGPIAFFLVFPGGRHIIHDFISGK
jgi:hypothetical protein